MFIFWKNWGHKILLSRFTDLYNVVVNDDKLKKSHNFAIRKLFRWNNQQSNMGAKYAHTLACAIQVKDTYSVHSHSWPYLNQGSRLWPPQYYEPPRFSDLATALYVVLWFYDNYHFSTVSGLFLTLISWSFVVVKHTSKTLSENLSNQNNSFDWELITLYNII